MSAVKDDCPSIQGTSTEIVYDLDTEKKLLRRALAEFEEQQQIKNDSKKQEKMWDNEKEQLKYWYLEKGQTHKAMDQLLNILRPRLILDSPKSTKTFLGTSSAVYEIVKMRDSSKDNKWGEFCYFGISEGLKDVISDFHKGLNIELIFNIDGMALTNSSSKCFWPILCRIYHDPNIYKPFVVAIYSGHSKPKYKSHYLKQFVKELNDLQENGIMLNDKKFHIKVKCFVLDTPARAFIKSCKGHGGYSACERCTIRGISIVTKKNQK